MKEFVEKLIERFRYEKNMDRSKVYTPQQCDAIRYSFGAAIDGVMTISEKYKDKYVSVETLKQVMWERDVAIEQLKELGYGFGEKVGWIPCSERLPEENIEVDVTIKEIDGSTYTQTSWLQEGQWVVKKTPLQPTVIAWKERPEPYKEGESIMQDEMKRIVICKHCGKPEYYGEMRWLNGFCGCRNCYKAKWQDENHQLYRWDDLDGKRPTMEDYQKEVTKNEK